MYIMKVETGGIATYFNCFRLTEKEYRSGDFGKLHAKFFKQGTRSDRYLSPASINAIRNNKEPRDVSVYEYLISNDNLDCIPVGEEVISAAEEKMGREFPYELRWFYQDVGCGSIKARRQSRLLRQDNREHSFRILGEGIEAAGLLCDGMIIALTPSSGSVLTHASRRCRGGRG